MKPQAVMVGRLRVKAASPKWDAFELAIAQDLELIFGASVFAFAKLKLRPTRRACFYFKSAGPPPEHSGGVLASPKKTHHYGLRPHGGLSYIMPSGHFLKLNFVPMF